MAGLGWMPASWALTIAMTLILAQAVASRRGDTSWRTGGAFAEIALMLTLYAAWHYAGAASLGGLEDAYRSGLRLAELESALGWPTEAALQQPVLGHEWVMRVSDAYYAGMHVPIVLVTLGWVLMFHRRDWPFVRTTLVLTTAACLVIQYKPVAPPRLLPSLGVVDTALRDGLSVYDGIPGGNQLSAMPSIHLAWAAAVALFIIVASASPWRWLALGYPLVTLWVVVVTGNHFIIDGVAAVVLLAIAAGVAWLFPSQRPGRAGEPANRVTWSAG